MCRGSLAHFGYIANIACSSSIWYLWKLITDELQNYSFHIKQTIGHLPYLFEKAPTSNKHPS